MYRPTPDAEPSTLSPEPQTPKPKPSSLNPNRQMSNPNPWTPALTSLPSAGGSGWGRGARLATGNKWLDGQVARRHRGSRSRLTLADGCRLFPDFRVFPGFLGNIPALIRKGFCSGCFRPNSRGEMAAWRKPRPLGTSGYLAHFEPYNPTVGLYWAYGGPGGGGGLLMSEVTMQVLLASEGTHRP